MWAIPTMLYYISCQLERHCHDVVVFSSYHGHLVAVWVYGSCLGGYNYTLKMSIYHAVRARKSNSNIFPINVIMLSIINICTCNDGSDVCNLPADSQFKYQHEQTPVVMLKC